MNERTVKVEVVHGDIQIGQGYCLVGNDEVIAFFVDPSHRVCVEGFSNTNDNFPSIFVSENEESETWTEIYFPEYKDWDVHSAGGGKTLSVCLVNRRKMIYGK